MIPYELIGRITVVVLVVLLMLLIWWIGVGLARAIIHRILKELINLCWRGYDIHGEHPPRWRRELSLIFSSLKRGYSFEKYQETRENMIRMEQKEENNE